MKVSRSDFSVEIKPLYEFVRNNGYFVPGVTLNRHIHIPEKSKLTTYVTAIWEVYGQRNIHETILPQGIVEMVFNLADGMNGLFSSGGKTVEAPLVFIQGFNTRALDVDYKGQHHLFGVRLQPHMVKDLLGIVPSELKDTLIDLTLIRKDFNILWSLLMEMETFEQRVELIEKHFPVLAQLDCPRTRKLCSLFYSNDIQAFQSLDTLSQQVCYSPRHLNRKVRSLFGVSAEGLISYKKFLHGVKLIHSDDSSLTEIAYRSGFYDQSHFSRTFKTFAGITPNQYRSQKSDLPFHLFS